MIRFALAAGSLAVSLAASAQAFVVPPELWDRPRSGRAVLESAPVRQAVEAWLAQPRSRLLIRHGAGQESVLAAEELRSWLAALAVEPSRIALRNDLAPGEPMKLEVSSEQKVLK
jgi:hypothetical protein